MASCGCSEASQNSFVTSKIFHMPYPFTATEKRDINQCRLFCGILTLADACTADGTRLARSVFNCSERGFRNTRLFWPRVPAPSKRQIASWRRMWKLLFLKQKSGQLRLDPRTPDLRIRDHLGRWTSSPTTRQLFSTIFCDDIEFSLKGESYVSESFPEKLFHPDSLPFPSAPWERYDGPPTLSSESPSVRPLRWCPSIVPFTPLSITNMQTWWACFIHMFKFTISETHCVQTLLSGCNLICCSDGSSDQNTKLGSFGFAFATDSHEHFFSGWGNVDGHRPSSFRAELTGAISAVCIWRAWMILKWCLPCKLQLWCDNNGFVSTANRLLREGNIRLGRDVNDADLVHSFAHLIWPVKDLLSVSWVKGHQDMSKLTNPSIEVLLNTEADTLASEALKTSKSCAFVAASPANPIQLHINNVTVTSKLRRSIMNRYNSIAIRNRIFERTGWSQKTFDSIFWEGLGRALASFPLSARFTLTKFTNNILPVGSVLAKRNDKEPYKCFTCSTCDHETIDHMFTCPGQEKWRISATKAFTAFLKESTVRRDRSNSILFAFFGLNPDSPTCPLLDHTLASVGRKELWKGKLPIDLLFCCTRREGREDFTTTHRSWGTKLCKLIFTQILLLWDSRNAARHGSTATERSEREREKLSIRIQAIQAIARDLPSEHDRSLLQANAAVNDWSTMRMRSFVAWAEDLATFCSKESSANPIPVRERTDEVRKPP